MEAGLAAKRKPTPPPPPSSVGALSSDPPSGSRIRDVLIENKRPDIDSILATLPKNCNPYFACMVVTCTKKSGNRKVGSASHHQRTAIYIARHPYDMIERLNRGVSLPDSEAMDLSPVISKLLPQQASRARKTKKNRTREAKDEETGERSVAEGEDGGDEDEESRSSSVADDGEEEEEDDDDISVSTSPPTPPPPPQEEEKGSDRKRAKHEPPAQQQQQQRPLPQPAAMLRQTASSVASHPFLVSAVEEKLRNPSMSIVSIHEEWIKRVVVAIRESDSLELSRAVETGDFALEPAIERLENLRRGLMNERSTASAAAVEAFMDKATGGTNSSSSPSTQISSGSIGTTPVTFALPLQQQQPTTDVAEITRAAPLELIPRRSDNERKRRRRQMHKKQNGKRPSPSSSSPSGKKISVPKPIVPKPIVPKRTVKVPAASARQRDCTQRLGMILGPIFTLDAARLVGVVWGLKGRGSIPRSALGERLAERFKLTLYADLTVIFEGEDLERHILKQTDAGELWLVLKSSSEEFDQVLMKSS